MGEIYKTNQLPAISALVKRVAAYARVSLETDKLTHSLSAQTSYYSKFIRQKPDWTLAGIYADSFISGTETSNRTEFNRLIADCELGKIDVVLCKSISRFARNTVDLLRTVRRLKELGIEVRFEKENINSLSEEGELMLTILASFAQEESRSISENVKWGIRKRFRAGTAKVRNKSVFGYRYDGERYVIVPEEAEAVRVIFRDYIDGVPLRKIAERLKQSGYAAPHGCSFSHTHIDYIVRNELYIGNIVLQKTFVKDFITHTKSKNRGELAQYRLYNCHEPIIDENTFAKAQSETKRRAAEKPVYRYTGKLVCGKCGKTFTRRSNNGKYACWHCRSCLNVKLKEDKLNALFDMTDISDLFDSVRRITVYPAEKGGVLDVEFCNGRTEKWQYE